jgi:hypothetical protein
MKEYKDASNVKQQWNRQAGLVIYPLPWCTSSLSSPSPTPLVQPKLSWEELIERQTNPSQSITTINPTSAPYVANQLHYVVFYLPIHPDWHHKGWASKARSISSRSTDSYMLTIQCLRMLEDRFGWIETMRWLLQVSYWHLGTEAIQQQEQEIIHQMAAKRWRVVTDLTKWIHKPVREKCNWLMGLVPRYVSYLTIPKGAQHANRLSVKSLEELLELLQHVDINWTYTPFETLPKAAAVLYTFLTKEYEREAHDMQVLQSKQASSPQLKDLTQRITSSNQQISHLSSSTLPVIEEASALGRQDIIQAMIPGQTYVSSRRETIKHVSQLPTETQLTYIKTHLDRAFQPLQFSEDQVNIFTSFSDKTVMAHLFPSTPTVRFLIKLRPPKTVSTPMSDK